jgi:hypothetical protein
MRIKIAVAALAILLAPTLAAAQKTSYDYNKATDFTAFKTYGLKDGTVGQVGLTIASSPRSKRSQEKGIHEVGQPRRVRRVSHRLRHAKDISTYSGYAATARTAGDGRRLGGRPPRQVRDILMGTLVIDVADAKKSQVAWRGMGVKEVKTQAKPEQRDKSINEAVKKIFKNYPPKVKK